jgi:hypothetical protein
MCWVMVLVLDGVLRSVRNGITVEKRSTCDETGPLICPRSDNLGWGNGERLDWLEENIRGECRDSNDGAGKVMSAGCSKNLQSLLPGLLHNKQNDRCSRINCKSSLFGHRVFS